MTAFTLGTSRLGTVPLATKSTDALVGEFRQMELHFSQGDSGGDLDLRYVELHLQINGDTFSEIT